MKFLNSRCKLEFKMKYLKKRRALVLIGCIRSNEINDYLQRNNVILIIIIIIKKQKR